MRPVAVVVPVFGNEATLAELAQRVAAVLPERQWRLRLVIDASPDTSLEVARRLAAGDPRIVVTSLATNVGQHRALTRGLADEDGAAVWICLDADLQDPPEAIPALLDRLAEGDVGAVFAGRRGDYQGRGRLISGRVHRWLLARLTGLPRDAGGYVALGRAARDTVVALEPPSIVAGVAASGVPVASVPVERLPRPSGTSGWTSTARLQQAVRTLRWALIARVQAGPDRTSHRCTSTST